MQAYLIGLFLMLSKEIVSQTIFSVQFYYSFSRDVCLYGCYIPFLYTVTGLSYIFEVYNSTIFFREPYVYMDVTYFLIHGYESLCFLLGSFMKDRFSKNCYGR